MIYLSLLILLMFYFIIILLYYYHSTFILYCTQQKANYFLEIMCITHSVLMYSTVIWLHDRSVCTVVEKTGLPNRRPLGTKKGTENVIPQRSFTGTNQSERLNKPCSVGLQWWLESQPYHSSERRGVKWDLCALACQEFCNKTRPLLWSQPHIEMTDEINAANSP